MAEETGGTLIRGADGTLYFIPDSKLQSFRVPDDKASSVQRVLSQQERVVSVDIIRGRPARDTSLIGSDSATISVANVAAIRPQGG